MSEDRRFRVAVPFLNWRHGSIVSTSTHNLSDAAINRLVTRGWLVEVDADSRSVQVIEAGSIDMRPDEPLTDVQADALIHALADDGVQHDDPLYDIPGVERPPDNATRKAWRDYADAIGEAWDETETRDDLRHRLSPPTD